MTIQANLQKSSALLRGVSTTPELDCEVLLSFVLGKPKAFLYTHADEKIAFKDQKVYREFIQQRESGKPVAYIVGYKEFYGMDFFVDERVLVPRPETEMIIDELKACHGDSKVQFNILDIGTGSGCIAITAKKEFPNAHVLATDISSDAIAVAQSNAAAHDAGIELRVGSLYDVLEESQKNSFDCIISNPPYVDLDRVDLDHPSSTSLRFEPSRSLKPSGKYARELDIITELIQQSEQWLRPNGTLLIEIGYNQGRKVLSLAKKYFPYKKSEILQDLTNFDRLLVIS